MVSQLPPEPIKFSAFTALVLLFMDSSNVLGQLVLPKEGNPAFRNLGAGENVLRGIVKSMQVPFTVTLCGELLPAYPAYAIKSRNNIPSAPTLLGNSTYFEMPLQIPPFREEFGAGIAFPFCGGPGGGGGSGGGGGVIHVWC